MTNDINWQGSPWMTFAALAGQEPLEARRHALMDDETEDVGKPSGIFDDGEENAYGYAIVPDVPAANGGSSRPGAP